MIGLVQPIAMTSARLRALLLLLLTLLLQAALRFGVIVIVVILQTAGAAFRASRRWEFTFLLALQTRRKGAPLLLLPLQSGRQTALLFLCAVLLLGIVLLLLLLPLVPLIPLLLLALLVPLILLLLALLIPLIALFLLLETILLFLLHARSGGFLNDPLPEGHRGRVLDDHVQRRPVLGGEGSGLLQFPLIDLHHDRALVARGGERAQRHGDELPARSGRFEGDVSDAAGFKIQHHFAHGAEGLALVIFHLSADQTAGHVDFHRLFRRDLLQRLQLLGGLCAGVLFPCGAVLRAVRITRGSALLVLILRAALLILGSLLILLVPCRGAALLVLVLIATRILLITILGGRGLSAVLILVLRCSRSVALLLGSGSLLGKGHAADAKRRHCHPCD
jgi:hypothetical protein